MDSRLDIRATPRILQPVHFNFNPTTRLTSSIPPSRFRLFFLLSLISESRLPTTLSNFDYPFSFSSIACLQYRNQEVEELLFFKSEQKDGFKSDYQSRLEKEQIRTEGLPLALQIPPSIPNGGGQELNSNKLEFRPTILTSFSVHQYVEVLLD
ncbi:hypothetical protein LXL04_014742 [Taraxacum kok-saghyz]